MLPGSARVFVSYSRSDRAFLEGLRHDLSHAGIDLWIDQNALHGSQDWIEAIGTQLKSSTAVLAILSSAACESKWVRYEIGYAVRLGKPIVPVRVQPITLPEYFDFTVGGKHDISFHNRDYHLAVTDVIRALDAVRQQPDVKGVADSKASVTEPVDVLGRPVYLEDAEEFVNIIPRSIARRLTVALGRVEDETVGEKLSGFVFSFIAWLAVRPPSSAVFLLLLVPVVFPIWLIYLMLGIPPIDAAITTAFVGLALAAIYSIARRWWLRKRRERVADALPRRPLHDVGPNPLTAHWSRVRPILEDVFRLPRDQWAAFVHSKCPDPMLRRAVMSTLVFFVGERSISASSQAQSRLDEALHT